MPDIALDIAGGEGGRWWDGLCSQAADSLGVRRARNLNHKNTRQNDVWVQAGRVGTEKQGSDKCKDRCRNTVFWEGATWEGTEKDV